jgi:hypothetical protein
MTKRNTYNCQFHVVTEQHVILPADTAGDACVSLFTTAYVWASFTSAKTGLSAFLIHFDAAQLLGIPFLSGILRPTAAPHQTISPFSLHLYVYHRTK